MADVLIKLYELPDVSATAHRLSSEGVQVRRALASERRGIVDWVAAAFSSAWADEVAVALTRQPTGCWVAVSPAPAPETPDSPYGQPEEKLLGFGCIDAVRKGLVGPLGVDTTARGCGVGTVLLVRCLQDMEAQGYAYAVAGWVSSVAFYKRVVGGIVIPDSEPGFYPGVLVPR